MYEVFVTKRKNDKYILLTENGILLEKYQEDHNIERLEGNIYLGKVQNVFQGMQAAFVNIGEDKNTFIHIKDILPQIDIKKGVKIQQEKFNIKDLLKPGMPLLVQVKKDNTNKKGAKVSTHISLSGKYIVLLPNTTILTISQKIEENNEKKRLEKEVREILPDNFGAIIRTSAFKKNSKEIKEDILMLLKRWEKIEKESKSNTNNIPRLIYKDFSILKKLFIDLVDKDLKVIVDTKEIYNEVDNILKEIRLQEKIPIELIQNEDILNMYSINTQLEKINNRKVWLKCGGFITIDKTEALTAIDVNSGKYIGKESLEKTVFTVNKEATLEILKQLRLRDIGGIIIIDYIDMKDEENKTKIYELLKEGIKKDRAKVQIEGFTRLNLFELTRKRIMA